MAQLKNISLTSLGGRFGTMVAVATNVNSVDDVKNAISEAQKFLKEVGGANHDALLLVNLGGVDFVVNKTTSVDELLERWSLKGGNVNAAGKSYLEDDETEVKFGKVNPKRDLDSLSVEEFDKFTKTIIASGRAGRKIDSEIIPDAVLMLNDSNYDRVVFDQLAGTPFALERGVDAKTAYEKLKTERAIIELASARAKEKAGEAEPGKE